MKAGKLQRTMSLFAFIQVRLICYCLPATDRVIRI